MTLREVRCLEPLSLGTTGKMRKTISLSQIRFQNSQFCSPMLAKSFSKIILLDSMCPSETSENNFTSTHRPVTCIRFPTCLRQPHIRSRQSQKILREHWGWTRLTSPCSSLYLTQIDTHPYFHIKSFSFAWCFFLPLQNTSQTIKSCTNVPWRKQLKQSQVDSPWTLASGPGVTRMGRRTCCAWKVPDCLQVVFDKWYPSFNWA